MSVFRGKPREGEEGFIGPKRYEKPLVHTKELMKITQKKVDDLKEKLEAEKESPLKKVRRTCKTIKELYAGLKDLLPAVKKFSHSQRKERAKGREKMDIDQTDWERREQYNYKYAPYAQDMPMYKYEKDPYVKAKFDLVQDYVQENCDKEIHGNHLTPLDTKGKFKPPRINDILDHNQ